MRAKTKRSGKLAQKVHVDRDLASLLPPLGAQELATLEQSILDCPNNGVGTTNHDDAKQEIVMWPVVDLKPHPFNTRIYGADQVDASLVESIRAKVSWCLCSSPKMDVSFPGINVTRLLTSLI